MDITEQKKLEIELHQAQKLESIGKLAAGIAHEINTPMQYISDSIHFLADGLTKTFEVFEIHQKAISMMETSPQFNAIIKEVKEIYKKTDIFYYRKNGPAAFVSVLDGIARITQIISAMKQFAHSDQKEKSPADLNHSLQITLTIAKNEYKYVADVETNFGEIPFIMCHVDEINQVFLNLIVNAANAIEEVVGNSGNKGKIIIKTLQIGDKVQIDITDTGAGIPEAIQNRIYDPFFTTKEVGKGSGQGLAIAHSDYC